MNEFYLFVGILLGLQCFTLIQYLSMSSKIKRLDTHIDECHEMTSESVAKCLDSAKILEELVKDIMSTVASHDHALKGHKEKEVDWKSVMSKINQRSKS